MKTMIRIGVACLGVLIVGAAFVWLAESRHASLVAADQPAPISMPVRKQSGAWQQPSTTMPTSETQILLRTMVIDVDGQKLAELGIGLPDNAAPPQTQSPANPTRPSPIGFSIVTEREAKLLATLLATSGAGKVLAEPTLVTVDGRPASFRSGGELPMLVPQSTGTTAIEFRSFGTSLDFVPKKLPDGRLRLELRIEQSELDHTKSVTVNGSKIPGIKTRWIDTGVELPSGKTAIFHNAQGQQLLVMVTAELVEPVRAAPAVSPPALQLPRPMNVVEVRDGMDLSLVEGASEILKFGHKIIRTVAKDKGVIRVQPLAPDRLAITGENAGTTTLKVWDENDEVQEIPVTIASPTAAAPSRQPTPLRALPTQSVAVMMQAILFTFDRGQLQADGLDLRKELSDVASAPQTSVTAPKGEQVTAVASVIGPRAVANLVKTLSETKAATLISRPAMMTLNGQSARINVGSRVRVPNGEEVQRVSDETRDVGVTVDLVPVVKGDHLRLEARAEHSRLTGEKIDSVKMFGVGELYTGETLALCQDTEEGEQLLLFVTPKVLPATTASPATLPQSKDLPNAARKQLPMIAERQATELKLHQLQTHYGPNHPEVVRLQQKIAQISDDQRNRPLQPYDEKRTPPLPEMKLEELQSRYGSNHPRVAAQREVREYQAEEAKRVERERHKRIAVIEETVRKLFPDTEIDVEILRSSVLISGTAASEQQVSVIISIADDFFDSVINNLVVPDQATDTNPRPRNPAHAGLAAALDELYPQANITIRPLRHGVALSGQVEPGLVEKIADIAGDYFPQVINHLEASGPALPNAVTSPGLPAIANVAPAVPPSLHREVRELREDVRILRRDVNHLIDLLETMNDASPAKEAADTDQSSTMPGNSDQLIWELIGIRAEATELKESRYRGGLKILELRPDSPASEQDLRVGDVLVGLDKWETVEREDLVFALKKLAGKEAAAKFYVVRGGESLFGHLKLAAIPRITADLGPLDLEATETWHLTLDEAIAIGLQNSKVIRNLGTVPLQLDGNDEVVISRRNADISLTDFEATVQNLVSDIEEGYWKLWKSYRDFDTAKAMRDTAQEVWQEIYDRKQRGEVGAAEEAAAREQYFFFRSQVEHALAEIHRDEQELRYLFGIAAKDGRLVFPKDQPTTSAVKFDSEEVQVNAIKNSSELRQQRFTVKQLEHQLAAARNALPQSSSTRELGTDSLQPSDSKPAEASSSIANLRNVQLQLAKAMATLDDMKLNQSQQLTTAIREADFNYTLMQTHSNRGVAAKREVEAARKSYDEGKTSLGLVLDAYRRQAQSETAYNQAVAKYVIAIKELRRQAGTLLAEREITVAGSEEVEALKSVEEPTAEESASAFPDPSAPLRTKDRLTIESLTDETLNRHVSILEDGTVTLPLLGQVKAAGSTLAQFREELERKYKEFYSTPALTVSFYGTSSAMRDDDTSDAGADAPKAPDPTAKLKPGDRLLLESLADKGLNRQVTILGDGTLTLPLLGQVPAAGRTLAVLKEELRDRLKKYYKKPSLTLSFGGTSVPAQ